MTYRKTSGWLLLVTSAILLAGPGAHAEQTLLKFARLIDGTGEALASREMLIEDGIIAAIGDNLAARYPDAQVTARQDLVAVPGLIDVHVHMSYGLLQKSNGDAWAELFAAPAQERLLAGIHNAATTLTTGVTTARDLSAFDGVDFHLKALIDNKVVPGPRLFTAGMGIHPLSLSPLAAGQTRDLVEEFSKQARQRIKAGASWVKIFATTGSADDLTGRQIFAYPEIKAATDIAHAAGLRVAVHSYSPAAVQDALRAGVDSIEHPVGMDQAMLDAWAATDVFYIPTIDHNRYYADHRGEYGYDDAIEAELRAFVDDNVASLRAALAAGIPIAMGSDAVMTGFGQNTRELEWFVAAGMSPAQALQSATQNGALLLGQENTLGRLQAGYAADIVAVQGDPLHDIRALTRRVQWVMKDGDVVFENDRRTK